MTGQTHIGIVDPEKICYRRNLWQLLAGNIYGPVVEVGVAEGNFAEEMLMWPIKFPVYLVDRWCCVPEAKGDSSHPQEWHDKNRERAIARVGRFGDRAKVVQRDSVSASTLFGDWSVAMVNVDADHSYEGVAADLQAWWPKLVRRGVISFHDYENPAYGVKKAVKEFAKERGLRIYRLPEDKKEDAGAFLIKPC